MSLDVPQRVEKEIKERRCPPFDLDADQLDGQPRLTALRR
jgi:hypothetical protein